MALAAILSSCNGEEWVRDREKKENDFDLNRTPVLQQIDPVDLLCNGEER